jgi:hypothetical protein
MVDTLHEDQYTFSIGSRSVLRMKNIPNKTCRETRNTILCLITFLSTVLAVNEMMWKNVVERGRPQIYAGYLRLQNTHTDCVIKVRQ